MAVENTRNRAVAHTPFLVDYAAFLVDFLVREGQRVGPVVKYEQTGVHHRLTCHRHVGYVIYSLVGRGMGIKVHTEFHTD